MKDEKFSYVKYTPSTPKIVAAYDIVIERKGVEFIVYCKDSATTERMRALLAPYTTSLYVRSTAHQFIAGINPCYTDESVIGLLCGAVSTSKVVRN